MKEMPILFSAAMVEAIRNGRKTVTRRVCNPQPHPDFLARGVVAVVPQWPAQDGVRWFMADGCSELVKSPYRPGDRLWVRERWRTYEQPHNFVDGILFAADNAFVPIADTVEAAEQWVIAHDNGRHGDRWRPSIFMKRWAARIVLQVLSVRLERLQDISDEDAKAEGIERAGGDGAPEHWRDPEHVWASPRAAFKELWDSINGKPRRRADGSLGPDIRWKANRWVWVPEFEVTR